MAIADLSATPDVVVKGPPCTVCHLLETLDDNEAQALRTLLANPLWRYSALSDALADEGHRVPAQTLARHARGRCLAGEKLR